MDENVDGGVTKRKGRSKKSHALFFLKLIPSDTLSKFYKEKSLRNINFLTWCGSTCSFLSSSTALTAASFFLYLSQNNNLYSKKEKGLTWCGSTCSFLSSSTALTAASTSASVTSRTLTPGNSSPNRPRNREVSSKVSLGRVVTRIACYVIVE
jgi:L-fucose isomerase-like protein